MSVSCCEDDVNCRKTMTILESIQIFKWISYLEVAIGFRSFQYSMKLALKLNICICLSMFIIKQHLDWELRKMVLIRHSCV